MLDVHAPHETVHTWRDFFIHIATIVVGLCIAVGLEQTVEFFHHRGEVKETRTALHAEREENRKYFVENTTEFRLETAMLENNLRVLQFLQRHPGTPEEKLPGVLFWGLGVAPTIESEWKDAQQTGVTALMPRTQTQDYASLYGHLEAADSNADDLYRAITRASDYIYADPDPSHMTPAQVSAEIDLLEQALEADYRWGVYLDNVHTYAADFAPAPTVAEVRRLTGHLRSEADQKKLAAARAISDAELAPSIAMHDAAIKAAGDTPIH